MDIYPSGKVMPYVYKLVHKQTGQFYFGSRTTKRQNKPSHLDLPTYQSSSDVIADMGFDNFVWSIDSEFFDADEAYWHEQRLIKDHIKNPLCLNRHYIDPDTGKQRFSMFGREHSVETKAKISDSNRSRTYSTETKAKISTALIGHVQSEETKTKRKNSMKDKNASSWFVTYPNGDTETITNMNDFCRTYGLNRGAMTRVAQGALTNHKGFRCSKIM